MLIAINRSINYVGFDRKRNVYNSALLMGGVTIQELSHLYTEISSGYERSLSVKRMASYK